jgi:hypothetical protein
MAAAYLHHLAGDRIEVMSAGSEPADQVNPIAAAAMAEDGISMAVLILRERIAAATLAAPPPPSVIPPAVGAARRQLSWQPMTVGPRPACGLAAGAMRICPWTRRLSRRG